VFSFAKRTSVTDRDFFGCGDIVDQYKASVLNIWEHIGGSGNSIQLYGELFGKGIQKNMPYSDRPKQFAAFSLKVNRETVSFEKMEVLSVGYGVPVVLVLSR